MLIVKSVKEDIEIVYARNATHFYDLIPMYSVGKENTNSEIMADKTI